MTTTDLIAHLESAANWMQRYLDTYGELGDHATQANIDDWHDAVKRARAATAPKPVSGEQSDSVQTRFAESESTTHRESLTKSGIVEALADAIAYCDAAIHPSKQYADDRGRLLEILQAAEPRTLDIGKMVFDSLPLKSGEDLKKVGYLAGMKTARALLGSEHKFSPEYVGMAVVQDALLALEALPAAPLSTDASACPVSGFLRSSLNQSSAHSGGTGAADV